MNQDFVDLLRALSAAEFEEAWATRIEGEIGGQRCAFIGREALIRNKRALRRPRDLADLEQLEAGG